MARELFVLDAGNGRILLDRSLPGGIPNPVAVTADGALLLGGTEDASVRSDTADPERQRAAVVAAWPAGAPEPSTVARARSLAYAALKAVTDAEEQGLDPLAAATLGKLEPDARPVAVEVVRRRQPSLRHLNSEALIVDQNPDASSADRARAVRMHAFVNAYRAAHRPTTAPADGEDVKSRARRVLPK